MKKVITNSIAFGITMMIPLSAAIAGDPVPGIDVSLEQIPGGIYKSTTDCLNVGGTITHKNGKKFCLIQKGLTKKRMKSKSSNIDKTPTAINHNSGRSNISSKIKDPNIKHQKVDSRF